MVFLELSILVIAIAKNEHKNAGIISYICIRSGCVIKFFQSMTVNPPVSIPAMAPALVIFDQYKDNIITGPNEAPSPAHAYETRDIMLFWAF